MISDSRTFQRSGLLPDPVYKQFFDYVRDLSNKAAPQQDPKQAAKLQGDPNDPMPQPNKVNPDGSKVYDLDGLNELMAWQSRQVEKRVLTQAEERLGKRIQPFEQE